MTVLKIISEYQGRGNGGSAIVEQISAEIGKPYRVTVCKRFTNLPDAVSYYLDAIPAAKRAQYEAELSPTGRRSKSVKESTLTEKKASRARKSQ